MVVRTDFSKVDARLAVTDCPEFDLPVFIKCHAHKDTGRPNLAVYSDHIHCFVCGAHIHGRIECLSFLLGITMPKAFAKARYYTNESLDAYRERAAVEARKDPLPSSVAENYNRLLLTSRMERHSWYVDRGISSWWIRRMWLGHTGDRFSIPVFDAENNLINIRFRRDDLYYIPPEPGERDTPKYAGMRGRNGTYFYPENLIASSVVGRDQSGVKITDWIVVCEGELDALRLWVEGIPAVSPTNGAASVKQVAEFLKNYPQIKRAYVCTDQDDAGEKAAQEFMKAAEHLDYVERVTWDARYKDITELLQSGTPVVSSTFLDDLLY